MLDETRSKLDGLVGALALWAHGADVLTRFARGATLDDDEERLLHLVSHAGLRVGERLLRAEDAQDHHDRIRAARLAPELLDISTIGLRWANEPRSEPLSTRAARPALAEVFGRGAVPYLDIGDGYAEAIMHAMKRRSIHIGGSHIHVMAPDLRDFLRDRALPEAVRVAARGSLEAVACFTAMALAVITGRDVRPAIATTLAERWAVGQAGLLKLLFSLPGVLPEGVALAPGWLLDLEQLFAESSALRWADGPLPPEGFGPPPIV
jgi:hypothetical protein